MSVPGSSHNEAKREEASLTSRALRRTFLAKKRLDLALAEVRASPAFQNVSFKLHFEPYQLLPDLPKTTDKQQWSLHNRHFDSPDVQSAYEEHMSSLFQPLGITLNFSGPLGNTFAAHRLMQLVQDRHGSEVASRLLDGLYRRYFCEARHPAAPDTLREACVEAGLDADEAGRLVADEADGEKEVRDKLRVHAMDFDSIPVVVVEGRRRDVTLTGAKEVADYVKALETITKESS